MRDLDIVGDAIAWSSGYPVAYATSRECCAQNGIDGPPNLLTIATLSDAGRLPLSTTNTATAACSRS
ncbi:MAG: hypothetical protein U0165_15020 [Polyangiaceae bacterium]